jgi:hypothetical protein
MPEEAGVVAAVGVGAGAAALGPAVGLDRPGVPDREVAPGPAEGIERLPSASPVEGEWAGAGGPAVALVPISAGGPRVDALTSLGPEAEAVVLESATDLVADASISEAGPESATAPAVDAPISDDRESPAADPTVAAARGSGIGLGLIAARESRSCLPPVRTLVGGPGSGTVGPSAPNCPLWVLALPSEQV